MSELHPADLDSLLEPSAFYGEDSGLIHMSIDCAERLDCTYQKPRCVRAAVRSDRRHPAKRVAAP